MNLEIDLTGVQLIYNPELTAVLVTMVMRTYVVSPVTDIAMQHLQVIFVSEYKVE